MKDIIGKKVHVIVDRPLGSVHPKHVDLSYPVNYGYIEGIIAGDGECQDCYILGENEPIKAFDGVVIGIIHRLNDIEDKLDNSLDALGSMKEDEVRARQQLED